MMYSQFEQIPNDVFLNDLSIFSFLKLSETNRYLNIKFKDNALWKYLLKRDFPEVYSVLKNENTNNAYEFYQNAYEFSQLNSVPTGIVLSLPQLKDLIFNIKRNNLAKLLSLTPDNLASLFLLLNTPIENINKKHVPLFHLINKYFSQENKDNIFSLYADYKDISKDHDYASPDYKCISTKREELAIILGKDYKKLTELFIQLENEGFQLDPKKHQNLLIYAAAFNNFSMVDYLLDVGFDINFVSINNNNHYYSSALHAASSFGHHEMVAHLIKKGANIELKYHDETPLGRACKYGYKQVIDVLLNHNAKFSDNKILKYKEIYLLVEKDYKDCLEFVLNHFKSTPHYEEIKTHFDALLSKAISNDHMLTAKILCQHGVKITGTHIKSVLAKGNYNLLRFFLDYAPNIVAHIDIAFCNAAEKGQLAMVYHLMPLIDINSRGRVFEPLYLAAKNGHLQIVKFLIQKGMNVNTLSNNESPLLVALKNKHEEIAEFLLANNANTALDLPNHPFFYACINGYTNIINIMLQDNPNLTEIRNDKNETPLLATAKSGEIKHFMATMELLIKNSESVNVCTNNNDKEGLHTPLHYVALRGDKNIVGLLLEHGANPILKTRDNKLPTAFATKSDVREMLYESAQEWRKKQVSSIGMFAGESHVESEVKTQTLELPPIPLPNSSNQPVVKPKPLTKEGNNNKSNSKSDDEQSESNDCRCSLF